MTLSKPLGGCSPARPSPKRTVDSPVSAPTVTKYAPVVGDHAQGWAPAGVQANTYAVFGFEVGLVSHLILIEGQGIAYIRE